MITSAKLVHGVGRIRAAWLGILCVALCGQVSAAATGSAQWSWSGIDRIVTFADVHGAFGKLTDLLREAGVVDDHLSWTGGSMHVVSLGDLLDRGPDSRKVMDLLMRLQKEAQAAGGRLHVVAGNHELMNVIGDLRYVAPEEFAAFADDESEAVRADALRRFAKSGGAYESDEALQKAFLDRYPPGYFAHRRAFSADGRYGRWILSLPALITINDSAYVHGGLPPLVAELGLERTNNEYRSALADYLDTWTRLIDAGVLPDDTSKDAGSLARSLLQNADPSACVEERVEACERILAEGGSVDLEPDQVALLRQFVAASDSPLLSVDGPLWYRGSVYCRAILEQTNLAATLDRLGVNRVVVGHTVTEDGRAHVIHDGRVLMLDTGMLVDYYKGRPAAMVEEGGARTILYLDPTEREAPVVEQRIESYGLTAGALRTTLESGVIENVAEQNDGPWHVRLSSGDKAIAARFFPDGHQGGGSLELAADALDGLLGFDIVPMTVPREIDGKQGALQLWYAGTITEADRQANNVGFTGWCSVLDQFQLMYAWDVLTANAGRNSANVVYRRDLWKLYLTAHGQAFGTSRRLPKGLTSDAIAIAPAVRNALTSLDEALLNAALGQWLDKKRIRALLKRRDAMLELL